MIISVLIIGYILASFVGFLYLFWHEPLWVIAAIIASWGLVLLFGLVDERAS